MLPRGGAVACCGAALAMAAGVGVDGARARVPDDIVSRIERRLSDFEGEMGVSATNLATGERIAINATTRFPTASLIKTAVLVETVHQIAEGKFTRDTPLTLAAADKVGDEPVVLNQLHDGLVVTVADLMALMIAFSDNTATNMLIGKLGTAQVNARMDAYGLKELRLFRPTFRDGRADVLPELEREFGLGMTTPNDIAGLFALLADGKVLNRTVSDELLAIMERTQDRAMIPRRLPYQPRTHPRVEQDRLGRGEARRSLGEEGPHPHRCRIRARRARAVRDRHLRPPGGRHRLGRRQ